MSYNGDLLKINGVTIPKLVSYKVGRAKLWKESERNMSGDIRATLIGIFPKIQVKIGYTTEEELSTITELLDASFFDVTWFDVRTKAVTTARYYASDYEVELENKKKGLYKPFDVSLVPVSKRRY